MNRKLIAITIVSCIALALSAFGCGQQDDHKDAEQKWTISIVDENEIIDELQVNASSSGASVSTPIDISKPGYKLKNWTIESPNNDAKIKKASNSDAFIVTVFSDGVVIKPIWGKVNTISVNDVSFDFPEEFVVNEEKDGLSFQNANGDRGEIKVISDSLYKMYLSDDAFSKDDASNWLDITLDGFTTGIGSLQTHDHITVNEAEYALKNGSLSFAEGTFDATFMYGCIDERGIFVMTLSKNGELSAKDILETAHIS